MKKGRLKEIVSELQGASKMHAGQATEISAHVKDMAKGASRSSFGPAQWMIESAEEKAAADIKRGYSDAKMLPMSNEQEEKFYNNPSNLDKLTPLLSNKTMAGYQENYQKEEDKKNTIISDGVKAKEKENDVASSQEVIKQNQKNIKAPTLEEYARLTAENVDKNKYVGPPKKKKNTCWKGYVAKGKKKSPSGKKNSDGSPKMVNNCVKISKKRR